MKQHRLKTIIELLHRTISTKDPRRMPPGVHISPSSTGPVLKILNFWANLNKSTIAMLNGHETVDPGESAGAPFAGWLPGSKGMLRDVYESGHSSEREQIKNMLLTAEDKHLYEFKLVPEGGTPDDARAIIRDNLETFIDTFQKLFRHGKVLMHEEVWYKNFKVFLPPRELLGRHMGFEAAMKEIRAARTLSYDAQDQVCFVSILRQCMRSCPLLTHWMYSDLGGNWGVLGAQCHIFRKLPPPSLFRNVCSQF